MQGALLSATVCSLCCSPAGCCGMGASKHSSASLNKNHSKFSNELIPSKLPPGHRATSPWPELESVSVPAKLKTRLLLQNEPEFENTCVECCHPGEGESV